MAEQTRIFSKFQIDLLLHLCNNYNDYIKYKITRAETPMEKVFAWKRILAWRKIQKHFNRLAEGPPRSVTELEAKYYSLIKELRKTFATMPRNAEVEVDQIPSTSASLLDRSSTVERTQFNSTKRKETVPSEATKYNNLSTSKAELVQRKINRLKKTEERDIIEHELRTKKLKLETEKLMLENLLLKKTTNKR